jgi:hypothetical protein
MQNRSGSAKVFLSISGPHNPFSASYGIALQSDSTMLGFRTSSLIFHRLSTINALDIRSLPKMSSKFLFRSGPSNDILAGLASTLGAFAF